MAKHDVNISINDTTARKGSAGGIAGKAAQTNVNDSAATTKLARLLKAVLQENTKKTSGEIQKAIKNILGELVKGKQGGGGFGLTDTELKRILRGVGKELGQELVKAITKSLPKTAGAKEDSSHITKAIDGSITKSADKMAHTIASRLSKQTGIKVDSNELAKGISSALRSSVPPSSEKAIRELTQSVGAMKTTTRDIATLVRQIGSMRQSGGKIDVGEISGLLSSFKKIIADFRTLSSEAVRAKESLKGVAKESSALFNELSTSIDEVKKSAGRSVAGVRQRAASDPKALTKEVVTALSGIVKKSESLKGTSLEKAVRSLEGKIGDMTKFTAELQRFQKTFKQEVLSGSIKIEGIETVLKDLDAVTTKLGNVPKSMGIEDQPKGWKTLLNSLNSFTKKTSKLVTQIKLIVDDSEINKSIPSKVKIKLIPHLDSKTTDAVIKKSVPSETVIELIPHLDSKTTDVEIKKSVRDKVEVEIVPHIDPKTTDAEIKKSVPDKIGIEIVPKTVTTVIYNEVKDAVVSAVDDAEKKKIKPKVEPIVAKIELAMSKKDLAGMRKGMAELSKMGVDPEGLVNELRKRINVLEGQTEIKVKATLDDKDFKSKTKKTITDYRKLQDALQMGNRTKSLGWKVDPTAYPLYSEQVVRPEKGGVVKQTATIKKLSPGAQDIRRETNQNIKFLSASLYKLQDQVVSSLDKNFADAEKKWAVVKPTGGAPRDAFKLTPGSRQWTMQIANLDRLQRIMNDFDSGVVDLISAYKSQVISERVDISGGADKQSHLVGQWLKTVSSQQVKAVEGLDSFIKGKLVDIKEGSTGAAVSDDMRKDIRAAFGDLKLENVFRKTYAEAEAKLDLQREGLVKQVALPAAKVTKTGDVSFQTVHGAERALPKFVKFETGFERLYSTLTTMVSDTKVDKGVRRGALSAARGYAGKIKEMGIRPDPSNVDEANQLALSMINSISKAIGDKTAASQYVRELYTGAAESKKFAVKEAGGDPGKFMKDLDMAMSKTYKGFDGFAAAMKEVNLSALDVAKSLNTIEVSNVYDIMGKVLEGGKEVSPIRTLGKAPQYERSTREFDKAISEIEGIMPLLEQNRPRRGYHQENVINLMTRTAPFYSEKDRLNPDDQKKLIKDLNLEINETLKRIGQTKGVQALPGNLRRATSLGIPESQAGNIEEYRPGGFGEDKFLKNLQATALKFYGQDLTAQAPFQQFQQAGRNISNITNAMVDLAGSAELPKLRSTKERSLIESGRLGGRGYGYNVTAELRNTASNFEDQIVIAGKLATALTSAVSTLVKPSQIGRVRGGTPEDLITGTGVTELKEQEITKVAKEYMRILGVPETYKGRADEVLIKDVKKTVSVVRGENVEVQQAKLAETFLNHFGRKFTTRYGSKGVSVTPTGDVGELSKILSKHAGARINLDPTQTLGAALVPKTAGKLASELFGQDVSDELNKRLIASGNKFIIDIFQKQGEGAVVAADEAKKTAVLFKDFSVAWKDVIGGPAPEVGTGGIKQIKDVYKGQYGTEALREVKPIDIRISSYGAAKRGLQTEFLESIFSNVAGAGKGGVTTMKKLEQPAYEDLLQKGGLSKYSEALGYKRATGTEEEIGSALYSKFTGKKPETFAAALASGDEKALLAKRAAALEAASSYYSEIIDEFGNKRTGLIGEKFVQIVEEPTENPEWQRGQVERGLKGAKLNLPAFSAYATVFGEQSSLMKEIQGSLDINAKKHWEYMKALQTIQDDDSVVYKNITKGLKSVDIGDVRKFDLSTGVYGKKHMIDSAGNQVLNPRSFSDTILDLERFTQAFKLAIPTGKYGPGGEIQKEELYVPGALARGTYPEPLLAGERGMDQVTRRLSHFVNMAKELQEVMQEPDKFVDAKEIRKKIPPIVGAWVSESWDLAKSKAPDAEAQLSGILNRMLPALSITDAPVPGLINTAGRSEYQYVQDFYKGQMSKVAGGGKTKEEAIATTISTAGDLLIGKKKGTPEQLAAPTGLTRAIDRGIGGMFAQQLGVDVVQDAIDKRVAALNKARIDYYNTLAETATGKTGSINELLFSRKIPAIIGKATTAVVDKRDDIKKFGAALAGIEAKYGEGLGVSASELESVSKIHSEAITNYQKVGIPVLKQTELGVPTSFAKKIPLDFVKKYKDTGEGVMGVKEIQPEKVSGTLFDLLKYTEGLKRGVSKESPGKQNEINKYIEEELVPYIESIRYPFTGTSSIAPFKPKLLKDEDYSSVGGRALAKNVLVAPGVPEGLEGLSPIISNLQDKLKSLSARREVLHKTGGSQEEIERLTSLIRELSVAISDVIPKYTAQAQKLDFDGDQIEIHSAKTASARKDIEKHFKRFHIGEKTKDPYTADMFRTAFLSEAAKVPTTGQYVLGESTAAFEKKFPAGKAFDFLKSPFLTEKLEYLDVEKAFKVMTEGNRLGDPAGVIKDVLVAQNKPFEGVMADIQKLSPETKADPDKYINGIINVIETQHLDLLKTVEAGIKKKLYEQKLGDAIEAQLFKVHTGLETESLYRVHRLAETSTGFGGGEISGRPGMSTPYFQSRFPAGLKSMGGRPEEEFNTMLNEMVRFGIQKGMDVKHAGDKPVAGEMVGYLSSGIKGAAELWTRVQDENDKTFGDLKDFAGANEASVRMRLGALSTSDVMGEAKNIVESRGEKMDVSGMDRDKLIQLIVDKVGFKGFLEELSILIKKEAIAGLIAQAETWSPSKKADPGGGLPKIEGNLRDWATKAVQQQVSKGGINIRQDITEAKQPLYSMRTSFASPAAEQKKYMDKFGDVPVPKEKLKGLLEKDVKQYKFKYRKAMSTAANIKSELRAFDLSKQGGAYADMIRGAVDSLYAQQAEVEKYVTSLVQEGYDVDTAKGINVAERTLSRKGVSSFANSVLNMKEGMHNEVERLSELAGVPGLSDIELFGIRHDVSSQFADTKRKELESSGMSEDATNQAIKEYVEKMVDKAQALKQLDRVIDALVSKQFEGRVLRDLLPRPGEIKQYSTYDKGRTEAFARSREKMKTAWSPRAQLKEPDFMASAAQPPGGAPGDTMVGTGGIVAVHVVGADPGVTINVKGLEGAGFIERAPSPIDKVMEMDKELQQFAKDTGERVGILKKTRPGKASGKPISYQDFYSPSKLGGGGFAYGGGAAEFTEEARIKEQMERIARDMVSREPLPPASQALADWGTAIHTKFEESLKSRGDTEVEKYGEFTDKVGGIIGGFADVVEYETPEKKKISTVADIKTASGYKIKKIKSAIEKSGSTEFSEVVKQLDDDTKRQLEDYFSQLNAYLKIFDETAKAEIRFYDREGMGKDIEDFTPVSFSFDPERFQKDMQALAGARDRVLKTGGKFLKTGVRNQKDAPQAEGASPEEIDRLMELSKQSYERERMGGGVRSMSYSLGASKRGKGYEEARKGMKDRAESLARKSMYKNFKPSELDKYLVPPEPVEGENAEAFLANLKILHDQAKLYQKSKGLSMDTAETMPKQIGEALKSVSKTGPDYQSFIDLTNKLKDMERPDFTSIDMINAWKLYRMEVGDWLFKRADEAYDEMTALEDAGDFAGSSQAYGDFTNRVTRAQEAVRRSIGKRTDIYTDDKRFVYPKLAQMAGVYQSPKQIMKKIGEPLGDDPELIEKFKTIIQSIDKEVGKTPPIEAARGIFSDLSDMNKGMRDILSNGDKVSRLGDEIVEAWDFDKLTARTARLRAALQQILKDNKEMDATQRKNVDNIVKYLKNIEGLYSHMDFGEKKVGYGETGIVPVPKFASPEDQKALHARNIQSVRQYFKRPQEEGGPEIGERFSYSEKIIGSAGETIKNVTHHFSKYGEELLSTGEKTGQFTESQQDIIEKMQRVNASFGSAVKRVVMWGAASRLVYGGISNLKSGLNELANIEVGIAQLRMVMSPLETDFSKMSKSATGLAKRYGVPVTDVLKSMKVFAQQGLKQGDVIDRTQTATLASNVTTLNAKEATEALTAAMKIFREEGKQSLRFLDAWSEVEAKHAITADDMANAIKKSAAAAKSAGVNFDELNGMVAAVGAVTRQTGKEVGTSFRFIFRRLYSEEGPKQLAKLNIPTIDEGGELRGAHDILGDLAGKWDDLSSAQRMNVAQSVGGTRQYNTLLVLMDQWNEVLRGIRNSTNSKGSAERRNAEIMKTYAKQLEKTKAAATEFKMEIGKIALPMFTAGTKATTLMFETLTAIPAPIKAASAALAAFFTLGAKGIDIFDMIGGGIAKGGSVFGNLGKELSKQFGIAKYEMTGKAGIGTDVFGLKTLTPTATKLANAMGGEKGLLTEQGTKISDFHSSIGKMMFQFQSWGKSYNEMIGDMVVGTGALTEKAGEGAQDVGAFLSLAAGASETGIKGIKDVLQGGAIKKGLSGSAVKELLGKKGIMKGGAKILLRAGMLATELAGASTYLVGQAVDAVGEQVGKGGHKIIKDFTTQNTGFVKSVAPLALTVAALIPALKAGADYFGKMTNSAQDFEKSMSGARRKSESQLKSVRDMLQEYDALNDKVKAAQQSQDPGVKARRQELGTYESPLTILQSTQERSIDLTNQIANANVNMVVGYDKLGNAVLKTGKSFKSYLKDIENIEVMGGVGTELEVLSKYLDDLSSGNKSEKIKMAFKELAEAFPVLGDLVTRNIKVSPAKALEVAAGDINKRLNLKQKHPLSTAADADIKRLQGVLGKARDAYKETFSDMTRIYSSILSRANLKGLNKGQIEDLVSSPELRRAYEMQIQVDPKFKLVGSVTPEDIMGKELLSALNPRAAGRLDVVAELTKANLESSGVIGRKSKVGSGDVVTFYKDMADKYNIAGQQAIVKLKDTDEWVIEYFNTRTLQIEERKLSDVEQMVNGIFPLDKIKEDLSYRMESLNTFVAGASAGLSGVSKKDFKRDFNLGERFFGEIPTTTLLQGSKGFTPSTGYGEVAFMKNFKKDIEENFFKPMEELRRKTEQFEKLKLEGLETGDVTISKGFYEEINKLLDVLKNNQVILQFRAVFVDLMKEMASGQRVLKEEIAIMTRRTETSVAASGLAAGMPIDLENLNLGVRGVGDITARQQLLSGDQGFRNQATQLRALEMTSQSNVDMIDQFERALVQVDDIMNVAEGFGAAMSPEDLGKYIEKVVPERGEGPLYDLKQIDTDIEKNTAATVDKLDSILENLGDPDAVEKNLTGIMDNVGAGLGVVNNRSAAKTVNALERVARIRESVGEHGNQEAVIATNKAIDVLTKQLVAQVGYKKGMELVGDNITLFSKRYTKKEFQQGAFSGVDTRVFVDRLKKYGEAERPTLFSPFGKSEMSQSKEFKNFEKAQLDQVTQTTFSSKNLARVAAVTAALSKIQQTGNKNIITKIDDQIGILDQQLVDGRRAGKGASELTSFIKKREALTVKREEKRSEADFYGTVSAISATGFAVTELSKAFGLTEKQINALGVGAAGTYAAMVIAAKVTGSELPDSAKKFGEELKKVGVKVAGGAAPGFSDARALKNAGKEMSKEFVSKTKDVFGKGTKDIGSAASKVDSINLIKKLDTNLAKRASSMEDYITLGTKYAQYAAMQRSQTVARKDLLVGGETQDSMIYKDLIKKQGAETALFMRGLGREDKRDVVARYPQQSFDDLNKYVRESFGPELEKTGDYLVRGLEKSEAPSKLKQAIVAYLAVGLSDYVSNKSAGKTALAETEKIMKRQSEALADLIKKYPEAADKALQDLYKETGTVIDQVADIATIDRPMAQDAKKAKENIKRQIEDIRDTYIEEQKKSLEEQRKVANKLADQESREDFKIQQEQSARTIRQNKDASKIGKQFSLTNMLNKKLRGYAGDVELPISEEDMSTQQRVYSDASKSFRNVIDSFGGGVQRLEGMRNNLEMLKQASREQEDIVATTSDDEVRTRAKERHKDLNDAMKEQITTIGTLADRLRKFGELKSLFDKFAGSLYQLKNALKEVGVQEAVDRMPGMQQYRDRMDMLLGGGHPSAVVPVSAEESRMGSRVGYDLQHMRSTRYDVLEAQLKDQLRDASPEESAKLRRQLRDLPEQRSRDLQVYEQRQYDSRLRMGLQPYEEQVSSLERVRTSPNITGKQAIAVEKLQRDLVTMLNEASKRMPIDSYRSELKANKGKLTRSEYASESRRLDELESKGIKSTYRGMPLWERKDLSGMSNEIRDAMKKSMMDTGEGLQSEMISDPIVNKIDETNAILSMIAEKEFGMDLDPNFMAEVSDRAVKLGGRIKYKAGKLIPDVENPIKRLGSAIMRLVDRVGGFQPEAKPFEKKAGGGRVFGAGGPKEDKVAAWLSPGEFVLRAHAAQKIGPQTLNYMNTKGEIPAFGYGGVVSGVSKGMGSFVKHLEDERLALASEDASMGKYAKQGALATTELLTRLIKSPVDLGSMIEQVAGYTGARGAGATYEAGKDIGSNLFDVVKGGITKEQISSFTEGMKTDFGKGGLGTTSFILDALIGGGVLSKKSILSPESLKGQLQTLSKGSDKIIAEQAKDALGSKAVKALSKSDTFKDNMKYIGGGNEALVFQHGDKAVRLGGLRSPTALSKVRKGNIFGVKANITDNELLARMAQGLSKSEINEIGISNKFLAHGKFKDKQISISDKLDTESVMNIKDPVFGIREMIEKQGAVPGNYGLNYFTRGDSGQFYKIGDIHPGNFGFDKKGKLLGIDPGMYNKVDWDKLPYDAQKKFSDMRQDPTMFNLKGKPLKKADGGIVGNWLKTAKDYWFGGDDTKDDERLLREMSKTKGIDFEESAGSYLESGRAKKKRYDEMLGFASGGEVDEDGRPIRYYTAYGNKIVQHENKKAFEAASEAIRLGSREMYDYAVSESEAKNLRSNSLQPKVEQRVQQTGGLSSEDVRKIIEKSYGKIGPELTKTTPTDLSSYQTMMPEDFDSTAQKTDDVKQDISSRSFFESAGHYTKKAVDIGNTKALAKSLIKLNIKSLKGIYGAGESVYGVGEDIYGTAAEINKDPNQALLKAIDFYDEKGLGIKSKGRAIADIFGTGKEVITNPKEAIKTSLKYFGAASKIKKTKTLGKDFTHYIEDLVKNIADPDKMEAFTREQVTDPFKNEMQRLQDFILDRNFIKEFGKGYGSDYFANYESKAKAPDKVLGKLMNVMGDITPSGIIGKVEGAGSFLSGGVSTVLGGLSGIGGLPFGLERAGKNQKFMTDLLTYVPKTDKASRSLDVLSSPFTMLGSLGTKAGDRVAEITESPTLAAMTATGIQALPSLIPFAKGIAATTARSVKYGPNAMMAAYKSTGSTKMAPGFLDARKAALSNKLDKLSGQSPTVKNKMSLREIKSELKWIRDREGVRPPVKALPAKLAVLGAESVRQGVKNKGRLEELANGGYADAREEDNKWGIGSMEDYGNRMLSAGKGRGLVDTAKLPEELRDQVSDPFMGLGARYDTDQFRRALEKKKSFSEMSTSYKSEYKVASSDYNRERARSYTRDQGILEGLTTLDSSRNVVGFNDSLVSYAPKEGLDIGVMASYMRQKLSMSNAAMKDPKYAAAKEEADREKAGIYKDLFKQSSTKDFDRLPGYLPKLKREFDQSTAALAIKGVSDDDKMLLTERVDRLKNIMKHIMSGADMYGEDTQRLAKMALYGGGIEKGKPLDFSTIIQTGTGKLGGYKYLTESILRDKATEDYAKAIGAKDISPEGAFRSAPTTFTKMMEEFRDGKLTDESRKKYQTIFRGAIKDGSLFKLPVSEDKLRAANQKDYLNLTKNAKKEKLGSGLYIPEKFMEGVKIMQQKNAGMDTSTTKGLAAFMPKMMDFFASMTNTSASVMHNGGVVSKTGKIFAERGELVIPKGFADGGLVGSEVATTALASAPIKLDVSGIISKLEAIELKVEDKELKVEDRTLKVEDKELKVEEATIQIDKTTLPKLEVDTSNLPKITVDTTSLPQLTIDTSNLPEIQVNTDNLPEVKVDGSVNAVGGEKFDQLAQTVESLSDRLIVVKTELDGKIQMIDTNKETTDVDRMVINAVQNNVVPMQREINDLRSDVGRSTSEHRLFKNTLEAKLSEMEYELRTAKNITGVGIGGTYNG